MRRYQCKRLCYCEFFYVLKQVAVVLLGNDFTFSVALGLRFRFTVFQFCATCFVRFAFAMSVDFNPGNTVKGELPPWEIAKAFAFHTVPQKASEQLDTPAADLVGQRVDEFIAKQVCKCRGGHPEPRQVRRVIARCQDPEWYPGKRTEARKGAGRKPVHSEHQQAEVARVAMDLKRKLIVPTPRRVRSRLDRSSRNPETGAPMSRWKINQIFATRCYDEEEDDPWQWLSCASQDALAEELKPLRVVCAKHLLRILTAVSWRSHVSIDPCYSLLPNTQEKMEDQKIAAFGKIKWMSKRSARKGANLRSSDAANTQGGHSTTRVDWTPVFARGRVYIYIVDRDAASQDSSLPAQFNDSANLAKFVSNVLPGILEHMKRQHGWSDLPRTVVHDKASYMCTTAHQRLQISFADALRAAGLRSWVGAASGFDSTQWLVKKWGDVYVHETLISHIRRLLEREFTCNKLHESPAEFTRRMKQVEGHLNSDRFAAPGGGGLLALAKELPERCREVIRRQGARIPKRSEHARPAQTGAFLFERRVCQCICKSQRCEKQCCERISHVK